jgi:hypothetical protein
LRPRRLETRSATVKYGTMPLTRTQDDEAALKHIVIQVIEQPDGGPMMKALAVAIDKVADLASIGQVDIEKLTYTADDGTHSAIGAVQVEILIAFHA